MVFNFGLDPTSDSNTLNPVAYMEHADMGDISSLVSADHIFGGQDKETEFNESIWEQQYDRWAQIIDTDHKNYIVLYSCMNGAKYRRQGK